MKPIVLPLSPEFMDVGLWVLPAPVSQECSLLELMRPVSPVVL
jgi:hypothetical protein